MIYFDIEEFDSPDEPGSGSKMKKHVLDKLDMARGSANVPFKINSGYRTKKHNKKIHGSPTSSHLGGWAVDIDCDDPGSREKIIYGLIVAGFQRIGLAEGFIHADLDPTKPNAIWLY
jgi:hypothetical protein